MEEVHEIVERISGVPQMTDEMLPARGVFLQ